MNESTVKVLIPNTKTENDGRFDAQALYAALDAQRCSRGMSWQQVALEVGVSASTLTRTKRGGRMEVDGMLAMVRWLNCTVESFTRGAVRERQTRKPLRDSL